MEGVRISLCAVGVGVVLCGVGLASGPATADSPPPERLVPGHEPAWIPIHPADPKPARVPLPGVLTASGGDSASVVTPAQAGQILNALWTLREEAFTSHSGSFMAEFEDGPALESDEVTCGCTYRAVRGPITSDTLLVPKQRAYPATFLAEVDTTLSGAPYVQDLIVQRSSATTPWKVVSDPGDTVTRALVQARTDAQGYDVAPGPPAAARRLPAQLAAYWQSFRNVGHGPAGGTSFDTGPYTTSVQSQLGTLTQGAVDQTTGLTAYFVERAGPRTWSFGTATGAITCGVVWEQDILTSPSGITQDPAQDNYGPSVAPGDYRLDAATDIAQPCFLQQAHELTGVVAGLLDPDTEQAVSPMKPPTLVPLPA